MLERAISFSPGSEEVINDRGAPLDAKVDVVEKTPWIDADDAIIVKGPAGQFKSVRCRVTESNILDKFDFPVGAPIEVCIKHQYYDTKLKVWSRDIASSLVTPHSYNDVQTQDALQVGLKGRFGTAISIGISASWRKKNGQSRSHSCLIGFTRMWLPRLSRTLSAR